MTDAATVGHTRDAAAVVRVAVPSPLRRLFDYLPPADRPIASLVPGMRVRVPFGRVRVVGLVVEVGADAAVESARLRRIDAVLDPRPLLDERDLALLRWAAAYFRHPPGEVFLGCLPGPLREGRPAERPAPVRWGASGAGMVDASAALARAPRQAALLARLRAAGAGGLTAAALADEPGDWRRALAALEARGLAERVSDAVDGIAPCPPGLPDPPSPAPAVQPGPAQGEAIESVWAARDRFGAFLLEGVTGSGKTEVYLALIERIVAAGRQALVLIPEIGLTPQIVRRFRDRLGDAVVVLHSALPEQERLMSWLAARAGEAAVVVGTRSAVFVPLARPGLVVVDEEHDLSFKQQDGFRYSARDLAVVRARQHGVPVVLGSATPSFESLHNVASGRYARLVLPNRAAGALPPELEIVDLRGLALDAGVSDRVIDRVRACVAAGEQALLFVNRRGFAPVLLCHACGTPVDCPHCDAHMVWHRQADHLACHHCGTGRAVPRTCEQCGGGELRAVGLGTERIVDLLERRLPEVRVARVDRDSMRRRGALEAALDAVRDATVDVLVGTQMLAKGHHFPNVTLVGVLDADAGLFSADFRAPERMAQLLVQVAGRAGRGARPGTVLVQTHHPDHPLLRALLHGGYSHFAHAALAEREAAALPPYRAHALLRAEAPTPELAHAFLERARGLAAEHLPRVDLVGPLAAPMERRAGRYRAQLLLEAAARAHLHDGLAAWTQVLEGLPEARKARWSLDVDPQEMI
ncbi:MAG: primosomal protein N' [Ectothiorhodospiraceae bacterium]|nr:primosomal protein N' [Chromatiales bacterium]MCP5156465.1 primosomal protein N' [Ectothiorhodospiraceae bacterium]